SVGERRSCLSTACLTRAQASAFGKATLLGVEGAERRSVDCISRTRRLRRSVSSRGDADGGCDLHERWWGKGQCGDEGPRGAAQRFPFRARLGQEMLLGV